MTFDEARAFIGSPSFSQLPMGKRAMALRQLDCVNQAAMVAAQDTAFETDATDAMALLVRMATRLRAQVPA